MHCGTLGSSYASGVRPVSLSASPDIKHNFMYYLSLCFMFLFVLLSNKHFSYLNSSLPKILQMLVIINIIIGFCIEMPLYNLCRVDAFVVKTIIIYQISRRLLLQPEVYKINQEHCC